jgi:hypothetical protein
MEHYEIEDAFRRFAAPSLELSIQPYLGPIHSGGQQAPVMTIGFELVLTNTSKISATYPYVRLLSAGLTTDGSRPVGSGITQRGENGFYYFEGDTNVVIHPSVSRMLARPAINIVFAVLNTSRIIPPEVLYERTLQISYGCKDAAQKDETYNFTAEMMSAIANSR